MPIHFWKRTTWCGIVTDSWNCVSGEAEEGEDTLTWPMGLQKGFVLGATWCYVKGATICLQLGILAEGL